MGIYKVNYGEYSVPHYDNFKYLNNFEYKGKCYYIGAKVELTDEGRNYFLRDAGYGFVRDDFRLVDHYFDDKGEEYWEYIIGWSHAAHTPLLRHTRKKPEELISAVKTNAVDTEDAILGELEVEFKEPNYSPKDWEVEGLMLGWIALVVVWIGALIFKDWWITLIIQICAGFVFGRWREKKINDAITNQKFKK